MTRRRRPARQRVAGKTDALNALDRAILHCATVLNAWMSADGQELKDWDYTWTVYDRAELTKTS